MQAENEDPLSPDEARFMQGVLCLREKKVEDVMTSLEKVYMVPQNGVLDEGMMDAILKQGQSRTRAHPSFPLTTFCLPAPIDAAGRCLHAGWLACWRYTARPAVYNRVSVQRFHVKYNSFKC